MDINGKTIWQQAEWLAKLSISLATASIDPSSIGTAWDPRLTRRGMLDSDVLIEILRGRPEASQWFTSLGSQTVGSQS